MVYIDTLYGKILTDRLNFSKSRLGIDSLFQLSFQKFQNIIPWFGKKNLEFGLLKFLLGLCCWQRPRVRFFVSWCELRLFSFLVEAIDGETGDGYRLNQIISVSLWFAFCLRSKSSLSSCWTFSSRLLWFSVYVD